MKLKATTFFLGLCLLISAVSALPAHGQFLCSEADTTNNSQVEVYYLGPNSNIYEIVPGTNTWFQRTGLAGQGPSVAPNSGAACYVNTIYNGNEIFYVASVNGNLHVWQLWSSTFAPTDLTKVASATAVAPNTGVVGYIDPAANTDNVFFIGTDQYVHVLTWSPTTGWKEDTTLDKTTGQTPAATGSVLSGHYRGLTNFQSQEVFYLGANQNVYELWRWSTRFDGWHPTDVTTANGSKPLAASGSPLAGFFDSTAGDDAMFYVGTNQNVYELLFPSSALWNSIDVTTTAKSNAPNAIAGSALAAHLNANNGQSEEVYFLDSNRDARELWSWSTSPTQWNINSYDNCVPAAAVGSPLSTPPITSGADLLYYIGSNDHVMELFSCHDITQAAGAPNAAP